jgi:hypothetical protein
MSALGERFDSPDFPLNRENFDWGRWKQAMYGKPESDYLDEYYPKPYFVNSVPSPTGRLTILFKR